ncbi:hypothetical protein GGS23DRAFT_526746 [Durotheca rogersii]|uniref:uncharacterized protein n=1 Tax=Durotheca rogersii TaxID=419775 RepID=UPI00222082BE|nr:uncharacterized protein GGS23DRAFT_526746 [Durotheca rogersii]KAI5863306.1 hypothetical protein GGS23DRAFT_526746 [Durotheca rogersii]
MGSARCGARQRRRGRREQRGPEKTRRQAEIGYRYPGSLGRESKASPGWASKTIRGLRRAAAALRITRIADLLFFLVDFPGYPWRPALFACKLVQGDAHSHTEHRVVRVRVRARVCVARLQPVTRLLGKSWRGTNCHAMLAVLCCCKVRCRADPTVWNRKRLGAVFFLLLFRTLSSVSSVHDEKDLGCWLSFLAAAARQVCRVGVVG